MHLGCKHLDALDQFCTYLRTAEPNFPTQKPGRKCEDKEKTIHRKHRPTTSDEKQSRELAI